MIVVWQRKHECLDEHIADLCGGAVARVACRRAASARCESGAAVSRAAAPAASTCRFRRLHSDCLRAEEREQCRF